jgi:predicted transcriptional regulator
VDNETLVTLTADIAAAFVSNNRVATTEIGDLISSVHAALGGLEDTTAKEAPTKAEPAVAIRSSVKPDYIVCLEDGKKLKMLKRHLMTHYQMTPAQYREKWNLKADYPMVAPNYAETRKALALKSGLGRKPAVKEAAPVAATAPATAAPVAKPKRKVTKAAKPAVAEAPAAEAAAPAKPKRKILKPALAEAPPVGASAAPRRGRRKAVVTA